MSLPLDRALPLSCAGLNLPCWESPSAADQWLVSVLIISGIFAVELMALGSCFVFALCSEPYPAMRARPC